MTQHWQIWGLGVDHCSNQDSFQCPLTSLLWKTERCSLDGVTNKANKDKWEKPCRVKQPFQYLILIKALIKRLETEVHCLQQEREKQVVDDSKWHGRRTRLLQFCWSWLEFIWEEMRKKWSESKRAAGFTWWSIHEACLLAFHGKQTTASGASLVTVITLFPCVLQINFGIACYITLLRSSSRSRSRRDKRTIVHEANVRCILSSNPWYSLVNDTTTRRR